VPVAKVSDDICLGVKGYSNRVIARSSRNAFKRSVVGSTSGGVENGFG